MTRRNEFAQKRAFLWAWPSLSVLILLFGLKAQAQLFSNLQSLVRQVPVGLHQNSGDGPKGIATADFDADGKADLAVSGTDGSVTVYFGQPAGRFGSPIYLQTEAGSLRGIVCADFDGDGRPDIATAAPFEDKIVFFFNRGSRTFSPATNIVAWHGVRNLATGDFDGDGRIDLVAAGPNNGLRQYRNIGGGSLAIVTNLAALDFSSQDSSRFPKPVYSLKTFHPPGAARDQLAVTYAETPRVWLLAPNSAGALDVRAVVTNRFDAHAVEIGPLLHATNSFLNDLIAVERDAGTLEIHAGLDLAGNFDPTVRQRIDVPGGPRAVVLVDLNGDGWNDLVVVQRNFDSILTFVNSNGTFRIATERPVGTSPREMVAAPFDADDFSDLAVMNRVSSDVSILLAYPQQAGYRGVNHLYLVDGNVAGLAVFDFNGDGRDDVIQLHRSSGDFSVRLANPDGTLQPPVFYTIGNVPAAQVITDVNHDGIADQITSSLGTLKVQQGFVSVRLGDGSGGFGPENRFYLPAGVEGRLFALVPGDFDGDGNIDLAAGFLDSRIAFFRGDGAGNFAYTHSHPFVNQARGLIAGDFDKDGDLDLAGIGVSGELWIVENRGDLLTTTALTTQTYLPPPENSFGGRTIIATDYNHDGDLDLVVGSGRGAWLYLGGPGMSFVTPPLQLAGTANSVSDMLLKDLDGDGAEELVVSCHELDCISVFTRDTNGNYAFAQTLDAPSSRFLATGDLDGDGKPDLIGSGRVLWTALSSQTNSETAPLTLAGQRQGSTNIVINEFLAINSLLPVEADDDHMSEWVEFYNGSNRSLPLNGWRLRSIENSDLPKTNEFSFPSTAFLPPGGHLLIYASETIRTVYHTGFRLPGGGGTLILFNPSGAEIDRVSYPPQQENVSYSRFKDGLSSFVFNPFPSPGKPNPANGLVQPTLKFAGVDPETYHPGQTIRFFAEVRAEVAVANVTMYYQLLNELNSPVQQLQLYDDGAHGDGAAGDGFFAGDLDGGLFNGAEIQFYFEITDVNDQTVQAPDEVEFALPGEPGTAYQLAMSDTASPLEISEIVASNMHSLVDEFGETPDWVEVRNISGQPVPMAGVALTHQIGDSSQYYFPTNKVLAPGEYFVIYCDEDPTQGPLHAPIHLSRSGDLLMLTAATTNNSRLLCDWLQFPALDTDEAYARLGARGNWRRTTPTPRLCNVSNWLGFAETNQSGNVFAFAFATATNGTYTVEYAPTLGATAQWTTLQAFPGDGIEKVVFQPFASNGFFRVRLTQ